MITQLLAIIVQNYDGANTKTISAMIAHIFLKK